MPFIVSDPILNVALGDTLDHLARTGSTVLRTRPGPLDDGCPTTILTVMVTS